MCRTYVVCSMGGALGIVGSVSYLFLTESYNLRQDVIFQHALQAAVVQKRRESIRGHTILCRIFTGRF
jgi:hypothetical protein